MTSRTRSVPPFHSLVDFHSRKERLIRSLRSVSFCILMAANTRQTAGPPHSAQSDEPSALEAHFLAAQQAQKDQDYDTATREYRAVLAIRPSFAEAHMNLGLLYQLQDHIPEAMAEFRRALQLKPSLTGANFFLGVDYCKTGEAAKAIPYLKTATRQEPNRADTWSWLATSQEMTSDFHAEVITLGEGLRLQPRNVDLLYLLGHAYENLGRREVSRLQQIAPGSARTEQLLAESYAASNAWSMAVIRFENALAVSPHTPGVHVEMGEVLLRAGRVKRAVAEFDKELSIDPASIRAITRRGEAKLILGDIEGALLDWTQAIDSDKEQTERILGLRDSGTANAALEQLPEALRKKLEELAPRLQARNTSAADFAIAFLAAQAGIPVAVAKDSQAVSPDQRQDSVKSCSERDVRQSLKNGRLMTVGHCAARVLTPQSPSEFRILVAGSLFETGDYDAALGALPDLSSSDRLSAEASYWRGRCYEKLATSAYLKLSEVDPDSYRMHQLLGDLAAVNDDDRKAIEEYRAAISAKPSLPNLHYSLGHLLWKNLQMKEARVEFEAELKLDPRHAGALNELGETYLFEQQPRTALPYLTRALTREPNNLDLHRDLGTAYSQLGRYEKAAEELRIAVAGDHDGSVHYKLARAYQALGQKEKAAHEFELSTALNRESHERLQKRTARLAAIENSSQEP